MDKPRTEPGDDAIQKAPSHAEDEFRKVDDHVVPKPESIRNMSDAETDALRKKMVRKLDCVIIPIIGVLYVFNYVDKSALAASKVYGIMTDLNMSTNNFATAISILFAGYLPFQIPSNLIMTKIPRPGLYLCLAAVVWGFVSSLASIVQSREGLYLQRVFLGVTEAVFFPGVIYYLSAWYTKEELGKRLAGLFMFQMLGSAFGGFIAAACLTLDGRYGIAGWRWLFIVEGCCTVGCGLLFSLIMPEYPHNARLLTQVERDYAVWRIENEAGAGEAHDEVTTRDGFKMALLEPKIWTLVFCMFLIQAMGSTVNFFPTIVDTLGYSSMITLLLTAPPYVLAAIWFYVFSTISDRKNIIYPFIIVGVILAGIAYTISLATLNTGARYFAMMLIPATVAGPQILVYKTLNLHMARPFPKRAAGVAMVNSIGGLSNIWASYLYVDSPHYYVAFGTCFGCATLLLTTVTFYRFHVRKLNRLLDGTPEDVVVAMKSGITQTQIDLGWRYSIIADEGCLGRGTVDLWVLLIARKLTHKDITCSSCFSVAKGGPFSGEYHLPPNGQDPNLWLDMATTVETRTTSESFRLASPAIELAPIVPGPSSGEEPADNFPEEPAQQLDKGAALRISSVGFAFFVAGFNDGGIGALIPYIIEDYQIDTNIVSSVYGAGFLGWFLVALTQTHLGQHYDTGLMFVLGAFLQTLCQALRAWKPPFALFAASFFFASAGQALQDTQGNTYVAGVRSSHRWLGFIHGMYAGGCLLGPFVATAIASARVPSRWPLFYLVPLVLGVANMGLVVVAFWERMRQVRQPVGQPGQATHADDEDDASTASHLIYATLRTPSVWLLSTFYFFYLGAILTASSWVVEYLVVVRDGDLAKMGYVPAGFQGGTLLGRLLLVEPIHRWGERRMVFLFCILSVGLQLLFWLVPNIIAASVAISLFGLLTGPFFPVGMSVATKLFSRKIRSTAMGFLFVISQLGGALFPIITGVAASSSGVSVLQPILVSLISAAAVTWLLVPKPKMAGNDSLHEE